MKEFVYLVAEGVLDIVFLTQVLRKGYAFTVIEQQTELPVGAQEWLRRTTKWPVGGNIARRAVPAPAFLQRHETLVGMRSAEGLQRVQDTVMADHEAFLRSRLQPTAVGIVLDADAEPPSRRFDGFADVIETAEHPRPQELGIVTQVGESRTGICALPGMDTPGSLEDLLLPLGSNRFPELAEHSASYVDDWCTSETAQRGGEYKELRKPAGPKKARLSAMVALLKPGKPLQASIEDQGWVPNDLQSCPELRPLTDFLDALLDRPMAIAQSVTGPAGCARDGRRA